MSVPPADTVLSSARAAASVGAWAVVRDKLERDDTMAEHDGAVALLLAEACLRTGDARSARRWLDAATPLLSRVGDRPAERRAINMQGAAAFSLGRFDWAAEKFGTALEMAQTDGDRLLTARAINNLGAIDALRGNTDRAIAAYQLAIPAYQRLGHTLGLAESWHNLGISYRALGKLADADEAERRASEYAGDCGNLRLVAMAQVGRAEIALLRGDYLWARANASRAATMFSTVPDYLLQADAVRVQADASDRLKIPVVADALLVKAYQLAREHEHLLQEAQILQTHAQIMLRRGDRLAAKSIALDSLEAFNRLGSVASAEEIAAFLATLAE